MCQTDFDYYYSASGWRYPRARKSYRCEECGRAIPKGEQYAYFWAVSDEVGIETARVHTACEELSEFVRDVVCGGHGAIPIGGLAEEIHEAAEYLCIDEAAWHAIGEEPPNPLLEVYDFIVAAYPRWEAAGAVAA